LQTVIVLKGLFTLANFAEKAVVKMPAKSIFNLLVLAYLGKA
jgi:hypothetical protein